MKLADIHYTVYVITLAAAMMTGANASDNITPWDSGAAALFTPGAVSMPKGLFSYGGNFQYSYSPELRKGHDGYSHVVKTRKFDEVIKLRYGVTENLSMRMAAPVINSFSHNQESGVTTEDHQLVDTGLYLDYRFLDQKKGAPFTAEISLGGYLPVAFGHNKLDAAGNDAWGGATQLGIDYAFDNFRLVTQASYTTFTSGVDDFVKGDRVRWNTALAYAFNRHYEVDLESTFENQAQAQLAGVDQHNSSTEWFLGCGVNYNIPEWASHFAITATLPFYRRYESSAPSDDYRIGFKFIKAVHIGTII